MADDSGDVPFEGVGARLDAVLARLTDDQVVSLMPPEALSVLNEIGAELLKPEALRATALRLIDFEEAFNSPEHRSLLIGVLPATKRHELLIRLGIRTPVAEALPALDRRQVQELCKFFNAVDDYAPRGIPPQAAATEPTHGLFEHQRRAALDVHGVLTGSSRRVMLHLPTGVGKTRTAMRVVALHLLERRCPGVVVWLASGRELLEQAAAEFTATWTSVGDRSVNFQRVFGSYDLDESQLADTVIFAGFAKLHALAARDQQMLWRLAEQTTLVVVDEAHQAVAPTFSRLVEMLASMRDDGALLGLSATPGRTWADIDKDEVLATMFKRNKVGLKIPGADNPVTALIEEGFLAKPRFTQLGVGATCSMSAAEVQRLLDDAAERDEDFPEELLDELGRDSGRNQAILRDVQRLIAEGHTRILLFAPSVAAAKLLATLMSVMGVPSDVVTGETGEAQRERVIRRFKQRSGEPLVLCNFGVLTTGFDAPGTSAAVIARPTRSLVLYSQMVGRAIRGPKAGGGSTCEVVTVVDTDLPGFGDVAEAFTNWEDVWSSGE